MLPDDEKLLTSNLRAVVREINNTYIAEEEEERLSDEIYYYARIRKQKLYMYFFT